MHAGGQPNRVQRTQQRIVATEKTSPKLKIKKRDTKVALRGQSTWRVFWSCFLKGVWRCLLGDVSNVRHATLLFCGLDGWAFRIKLQKTEGFNI